MTSLDAGTARARYDLDISGFERNATRLLGLYQRIAQEEARLGRGQRPGGSGAGGGDTQAERAARQRARAIRELEQAMQRQAREERALLVGQQQVAASAIRVARAEQDYARALRLVDAELARAIPNTRRYNDLLAQRATIARQQAASAGGGGPGLGGALAAGAGALGIGLGAGALVQGGIGAGREALALRETQNTLKAVSGDLRTYGDAVATARQQQLLFGGSLRENIEGLTGLQVTARQTGASLSALVDLSARLAVLSPEQGAAGARIALAEAFSEGNITSLARRFEIPRSALEKIRDTSLSVEERIAALDAHLNTIGITSAAVAGRVDQDALAYRRLAQEVEALSTGLGGGLATGLSRAATGLARLIGLVNDNPEALAELRAVFGGSGDVGQAAEDIANARARELLGGQRGGGLIAQRLGGAEQFGAVQRQIARIIAQGPEARAAVERLTDQWRASGGAADLLRVQLNELERQIAGAGTAAASSAPPYIAYRQGLEGAAGATRRLSDEQIESIQNQQAQQVAAQESERVQQLLADAAFRVATGQSTQTIETQRLAAAYPELASQAFALVGQQVELARATDDVARALREQQLAAQQAEVRDLTGGRGPTIDAPGRRGADLDDFLKLQEEQRQADEALAAARQRQIEALETTAQRVARLRRELADTGLTEAERVDTQTELALAEQRLAAEQERLNTKGLKSSETRARQESRLLDQRLSRQEDFFLKSLQQQEDYQTRARRSEEDFALRRSRDIEDFERQRRRLLAEGRIFEARQLTEEFTREQRRAAEDQQRTRARAAEDFATQQRRGAADVGLDVSRISGAAPIRGGGATAGPAAPPLTTRGAAPGALAAGGGGGERLLRIQFAPISLVADGRVLAQVAYPETVRLLTDDLIAVEVAAPPQTGAQTGVSGPRP